MIVTITMNPAVDKSTTLDKLIPEKKLRCAALQTDAGGGGINVSKGLRELGGKSIALFPAGGANGKFLQKLLKRDGIDFTMIEVMAETRETFNITALSNNEQFRFIMPGNELDHETMERCLSRLKSIYPFPSIIVASGSLPPGIPEDFFARVASIAKAKGSKLIVDTSGDPLKAAAKEGVYMLKPNLGELAALTGKGHLQDDEILPTAQQLIAEGNCEVAVISMGAAGAMLVSKDFHETISAPDVKKQSTSGAGDSMVAGMTWMLEQEKSLSEILRFGVACGSAATMNPGTQLFTKADALRLYEG
jgi:6-phosphofructokinase 2